jgi:hypothetical protein
LIKELFMEGFEQDCWVYGGQGKTFNKESLLEKKQQDISQSVKEKEEVEIFQDINFQRDLGPLSR